MKNVTKRTVPIVKKCVKENRPHCHASPLSRRCHQKNKPTGRCLWAIIISLQIKHFTVSLCEIPHQRLGGELCAADLLQYFA